MMRSLMRALGIVLCLMLSGIAAPAMAGISVVQAKDGGPYDPVTLEFNGPVLNEASGPNPFADYRLDAVFSDGTREWTVPGYFAGCANAADRSCTSGRLWRAHFVPQHGGTWSWRVRFRTGPDIVATGAEGAAVAGIDGSTGSFTVGATPRSPVRARGLLRYTGETYYRWSGDGSVYFKFGPDAPENMLAYADFDATPNYKSLRKDWAPHLRDYDAATGSPYLWAGGKGKGLLGMFNYLHETGLNTVSMLLFNVGGDDRNVIPQLLRVTPEAYIAMTPQAQWEQGVVHDRYDISKLAQWQRALGYADELGLKLHFKVQENEGDRFMDAGRLGRERKIYIREMMARYNHFLAVTWNMGEENFQSTADVQDLIRYAASLDPYGHPLVLHTYPQQKERYRPLLGGGSALNGLSLQGGTLDFSDLRGDVVKWSTLSQLNGRPWVMGYDEAGDANVGAPVDADYPAALLPEPATRNGTREIFRRKATWNALTAGSEGIEAYYGYRTGCTDLNCQDHRSRAGLYADGARAIRFFERHVGVKALAMRADDELTSDKSDYVFADPGRIYVIYTTSAAPVRLSLFGQAGRYRIWWYDPVDGGELREGTTSHVDAMDPQTANGLILDLGKPPAGGSGEWAVLVEKAD